MLELLPYKDFLITCNWFSLFTHRLWKVTLQEGGKILLITTYILSLPTSYLTAQENLVLHYNRPVEFFEEALVIGNGTMGAILYGGTNKDVLSLNDITLWTGEPDRKVTTPDAYTYYSGNPCLVDKEDYQGADRAQRRFKGHYSETISRWANFPSLILPTG